MKSINDILLSIDINITKPRKRTQVIGSTNMVVMHMGEENSIYFVKEGSITVS